MEIPRHWRLKAQRYRLEGTACPACGQAAFPPRLSCPRCAGSPSINEAALSTLPCSRAWVNIPVRSESLPVAPANANL